MASLECSKLVVMVSLEGVLDRLSIRGSLGISNSLGIGCMLGSKSLLCLDVSNLLINLFLHGSNVLRTNDVDILRCWLRLVGDEVGLDNLLVVSNVLPLCKTIIGGINFDILICNLGRIRIVNV